MSKKTKIFHWEGIYLMGIKEDITKIYVGYYDRAPDPAGLDYWIGRANGGMTLSEIAASFAVQPESIAKYPYLDNPLVASASAFVTSIYNNLFNRAPDTAGLTYWVAELAAGKAVGQMIIDIMSGAKDDANGNDLSTLNNKVAVGVDFASDLAEVSGLDYENNAAAKAAASAALAGVTDAAGTITTAQAATDAFVAAGAGVGNAIALTTGLDAVVGTAGADVISATALTLNALDTIDGADGVDTLYFTNTAGGVAANSLSPAGSSITNIEKLSVGATGGVTLNTADLGTFTDVSVATPGAVALGTANAIAKVSLTGTAGSTVDSSGLTNVMLTNTSGVLANTSAVAGTREVAVTLNNSAGYSDGQATTLNVNATGAASTAATIAGASATAVNISGDVALTVGTFGVAAAATVTNTSTAAVTILPALLNDTTYVGGAAADAITLAANTKATTTGAGDDTVTLTGAALGTGGTVDAGAGTDTLAMTSANAATASLTATLGDAVSNFETLSLGAVAGGATDTVKMSNLDSISNIVSAGTAAAVVTTPAVKEVQTLTIASAADANGGLLKVGGVDIQIGNLDAVATIQAAIIAQQAALIAANPTLESVTAGANPGEVVFTHLATAGPVAEITVAENASGVTVGAVVDNATPSAAPTAEVQKLTFATNAGQSGTFQVSGVDVSVLVNDTPTASATAVAAALTAAIGANNPAVANLATATSAAGVVTLTYKDNLEPTNDVADATVTGADTIYGGAGVPTYGAAGTVAGLNGTGEIQTFTVTGSDADGGQIVIGGVKVAIAGGLSADAVGSTIVGNLAAIKAGNPTIDSIGYNTTGSVVSITYLKNSGNVAAITAVSNDDHSGGATPATVETTAGVLEVGTAGGMLNITDAAANSTVEFTGAVNGASSIVLADATGTSDVVNLKLSSVGGAFGNTAALTVAGVETVNVATSVVTTGAQFTMPLTATAATTVMVSGNAGLNLAGSTLTAATTVDGSGLTGTGAAGGLTVATVATTGVTITGGAGNDNLAGSSAAGKTDTINGNAGNDTLVGGAGNDTINGGAGTDTITGGLGVDTLTGGADADTFVYTAAAQSNSVNVDVITDFVSGTDKLKIDVSGAGTYAGEAVGYGAVLTALANTGTGRGVLDTSTNTLYVDVDGNGVLNTSDYAIQLTGVTDLAAADFMFV